VRLEIQVDAGKVGIPISRVACDSAIKLITEIKEEW